MRNIFILQVLVTGKRNNGETVKYEADGNMTYGPLDGKMVTYTYDSRNRLVSVGNISYEYDCENNRIALVKGNYREDYVVDTVSSAFSRVLVRTIITEKNETTTIYHYGNGLISQRKGADYSFYHYNHNGSTTALTDLVGNITNTYTYGPYGELLTGDTTTTCYLYNGQYGVQTDPNGLYYMRQRYYNTEIKRFINQDILTGSINNSQSLNRYCYVQGNPISYTDPFGLSPLGMLKEIGHSVLDVAGLIPGAIGVVADTVNCIWYALEGNTAMAISCGISALPGLGAFAGAKLAVKGGKLAKVGKCIASTTSFIGNGVTFTRGGSEALNMGTAMWEKYVIQKEKISGETLGELAIFAMGVFTAAVSGKECLSSGNALRKQLKESGLLINLDNRGCVDFSAILGKRSESLVKNNYVKSNLKFGDNDLVYGPSAYGKLVDLQKSAGGKLLSDVGNPYDMGYGSDWLRFSTDTIENTVKQGNYIHFDLTNMEDIDGILNGTSQYMNRTTSGELRYIRDNWDRLSGNVKFYNNGEEVLPPWTN